MKIELRRHLSSRHCGYISIKQEIMAIAYYNDID